MKQHHPFEQILTVSQEDIEFNLQGINLIDWADFWLNPRRLRGSDFLIRWSQGVWSEQRLTQAVNATQAFFALPYGPSSAAPTHDVRAFELYFERLQEAGLGQMKRPDLLIFAQSDHEFVHQFVSRLGGAGELPFTRESELQPLIAKAKLAVECENSLWIAEKMPDYGKPLQPQKRLSGKLGLPKKAVLPVVIIKEEDRIALARWQETQGVPLHMWHVYFERAFGLAFNEAERLVREKLILPTEQVFQAPDGTTAKKFIYKHYYHYAYLLGISAEKPQLSPHFIEDKHGHILPFVKFEGAALTLDESVIALLKSLR